MKSAADNRPAWVDEIGKDWTVFLDRDGVINERLIDDYVKSWDEWDWFPGSLDAIVQLSHEVGRVIVITNQQGIAKGLMTGADLSDIHQNMKEDLRGAGGEIDAVFHCPHGKNEGCNCRKPRTGMYDQARMMFPEINPARSVMVGDSTSDMEWAKNAGIHSVAVGEEAKGGEMRVKSLKEFVDMLNGE